MSCGCNNNSSACPEVPYPQISRESVPSLIDNLVYALYGTINKSVVANRVAWDIPCDPASNPAEVPGLPRMEGEGLLCYIMRAFVLFATEGFNINSPFLRWSFTGNGTTQSYDLPDAFGLLPNSYLVYIDGVVQDPINFTISNTNPIAINFSSAIPNGSVVTIISLGGATPSTDVTNYTATPDNSSTSNTIGYWLAQSTFNQNSNYQVTGTPTARNLATRGGDVINVKDFGATGNGTTDDTAAIQSAINAAPAGGAIYFPRGSYKAYLVQVTKDITIFGDGIDVTEFVFGQEYGAKGWNGTRVLQSAYFILHGEIEFTLRDATIVDKFGLRATGKFIPQPHAPNTGWPIEPMGICGITRDDPTPANFPNLIDVQNVKFLNLAIGIECQARKLILRDSQFICTYGYAGRGIAVYQLGNGPLPGGGTGWLAGDPPSMVLGCFGTAIIKNNYFNGLVDETFAGSNKPTNWEMYRIATDNFIENQMRQHFVDAWMTNEDGTHDYSDNTVVNHGIEGIHFYTGDTVNQFPQRSSLSISNNFIKPFQNNYVNYAQTVNPCIALGGRLPQTKIVGNRIENTYCGIGVDLTHFSATVVHSLVGNIEISNNVLNGVKNGINVIRLSERDIISNNTIFCQSKPNKLAMAILNGQGIWPTSAYSSLQGIYVANCNPLVINNVVSAEYDWAFTTTTTNQASNVFTLAATSPLLSLPNVGIFFVDATKVRWCPITNVSGNVVTVDAGWLGGSTFANGSNVYFTPYAAFDTAAIVVVNNDPANVPIMHQKFYNTTSKGFLYDITATDINGDNGGINKSATIINTTLIDCKQSNLNNNNTGFFKKLGFYQIN